MTNYTKESVVASMVDFQKKGWLIVSGDLKKVNVDMDYVGKVFCVPSDVKKYYCFSYICYKTYCTRSKMIFEQENGRNGKLLKEIVSNWEAILNGTYESVALKAAKKKEAAEKRKTDRLAEKLKNKKTIAVDYFSEGENGYKDNLLEALMEAGEVLCKGEYVDIVLNDLITIEYRTTSKRRDLGYTVRVANTRTFEYDEKYGDLWENLDDNFEKELLNTIVGGSFSDSEMDNVIEFLEMYVEKYQQKYADNLDVLHCLDLLKDSIYDYDYFDRSKRYSSRMTWETKKAILHKLMDI